MKIILQYRIRSIEYLTNKLIEAGVPVQSGATKISASQDEAERLKFWVGRKAAFPAAGRVSPDYYCMDGTIPGKHLADVLQGIEALSQEYGLRVA